MAEVKADGPSFLSEVLIAEYRAQGLKPELTEAEVASWPSPPDPQGRSDVETAPETKDAPRVAAFYAWLHRNGVERSALCISGGGIRSATFGLGLIQSLARHRLLSKLDYLSTVSGGGYVGGWLSAWIHQAWERLKDGRKAVEEVEQELAKGASSPLDPEPLPIQHLRQYSRYMSPRVGLFQADTWTLVAIYVRNLLLNWLVLLPVIAAALIVPRLGFWLVRLGDDLSLEEMQNLLTGLYWLAVVAGAFAIAYIGANRPSLGDGSRLAAKWRDQRSFLLFCLLPLAVMAVAITLYWAWRGLDRVQASDLSAVPGLGVSMTPMAAFAIFGALMHLLGFAISWIWVRKIAWKEFVVVVVSGGIGGLFAWLVASKVFPSPKGTLAGAYYVWLAAPCLLLLFFLATVVFAALASHYTGDDDREWLARASGWILIAIFARVLFVGLVIFGPVLLLWAKAWVASIGGVSGVATYVLSRRSGNASTTKNGEKKTGGLEAFALALAAPLFIAALLAGLSLATTFCLEAVANMGQAGIDWGTSTGWSQAKDYKTLEVGLLSIVENTPAWAIVAVFLALVVFSGAAGYFVDVNRFSVHGAYRDRLVRAYLGASRGRGRAPNPFTGFDPADNVEMSAIAGNRPFHVVNTTLNLVSGKELAWQDRKAETFTVTPLHCGNLRLGYRESARYGQHRGGGRAISLGTAVATSGAAASPNMGYHSSPVITFLLAFFNVRLGRWQGNPGTAGDQTWDTPGPKLAGRPLFDEALGLTDDSNPYVYLSDGGHFENLALYEMVMRRVRYVVLSDAGSDASFSFEDLGNVVAKVRIDFGIPICFDRILMRPRGTGDREAYDVTRDGDQVVPYFAVGRILYSAVDGPSAKDGLILYFKPSLNGTEPLDVFRYSRNSKTFPHESTADQLYTESQFESYRALGFHAMESALDGLPAGAGLEELFARLVAATGPAGECPAA